MSSLLVQQTLGITADLNFLSQNVWFGFDLCFELQHLIFPVRERIIFKNIEHAHDTRSR